MSDNYYDYLADCALMVGANEFSGLLPPQNVSYDQNSYLSGMYQQQILAAISSTVAIFPFSKNEHDYPPIEFRKVKDSDNSKGPIIKRQVSKNELKTIQDLVYQYNITEVPETKLNKSMLRRNSKYRSRRSIKNISIDDMKGSWGSVSLETIKSFPATYFNNNLAISHSAVSPKIRFIPMTDNMGDRSFAIVMEFHRPFVIMVRNEDEGSSVIKLENLTENNNDVIYVPNNLIIFSKYPYFDLFRDILSSLHRLIELAANIDIERELMEYISILTRVPILKSEALQLKFSIYTEDFIVQRTHQPSKDIVDWDMTTLLQLLPVEGIVSILMAMFQEQKMVFFADDSNIITICTETIFLLFRPFNWKHFYLTTTPSHLHELVDAIFPFILGLPHNMKNTISKHYSDVIIVDLEEGTVSIPTSCNLKYVSNTIIEKLKEDLKHRPWLKMASSVSSLNPISLEELKNSYSEFKRNVTEKILSIFMNMMVDVFGDLISNTSFERKEDDRIVANSDKFLNTSNSPNIAFFHEIVKTDNYNCFIYDIIQKNVINGWVNICNQRYPNLLSDTRDRAHSRPGRIKSDSDSKFNDDNFRTVLMASKTCLEVVLATSKNLRANYHKDLLKSLSRVQHTIDGMKLKAEMYLRQGDVVKSLEEFYKILKLQPEEVNYSKLRKIIRNLKTDNLVKLKMCDFHRSLFEIIKFDEGHRLSTNFGHNVESFNPPTVPITKTDFIKECEKANIAENEVAMNALFNCLTMDPKSMKSRIKRVNPDIFSCFYDNWISSSMDVIDIKASSDYDDEIFIKATETCIKVDGLGMGRVALTQYQLWFIPFGKNHCDKVVNFIGNDLIKVKIDLKLRGFGKMVEVLELTISGRDRRLILWLADATSTWYKLISEIHLVNRLAQQDKDKALLDITVEQCLMYDNILACARSNAYFKTHAQEISKKLLPYSNEKTKALKPRNEDHRKYLIIKMMPSPKQSITIDYAINAYDTSLNNFKIWCACMSQDRYFVKVIKVVDRNQFKVLEEKIELPIRVQTITKMLSMNRVIVLCMSHIGFIINTITYSIEKKITLDIGKGSYPTCSYSSTDGLAYIGTNNGELLSWNYNTEESTQIYKLPTEDYISSIYMYNYNTLVVASLYNFYLVSIDGEMLNVVVISEYKNLMSKLSCITLNNNNMVLLAGLARLPVILEYDLRDPSNVRCIRKENLFTRKEFFAKDTIDNYKLVPDFVGIVSILVIEESGSMKNLWVMFKDGSIEVRDYKSLQSLVKFNAHIDVINTGMVCKLKNQKVVVSVGKEDGKVILWDVNPSV